MKTHLAPIRSSDILFKYLVLDITFFYFSSILVLATFFLIILEKLNFICR